jgi:hypothetical protein
LLNLLSCAYVMVVWHLLDTARSERYRVSVYTELQRKDYLQVLFLNWSYLRQVNKPHSQGFKPKYSSCFISFSSLNHYLDVVSTSLQEMRVLEKRKNVLLAGQPIGRGVRVALFRGSPSSKWAPKQRRPLQFLDTRLLNWENKSYLR